MVYLLDTLARSYLKELHQDVMPLLEDKKGLSSPLEGLIGSIISILVFRFALHI